MPVCPCCKRSFKQARPPPKGKEGMAFRVALDQALTREGVTNSELARRLGVLPSRIPQILQCDNLTERTFKDCIKALGLSVDVKILKRKK